MSSLRVLILPSQTLSSQRRFIDAVAKSAEDGSRSVALTGPGGSPVMYGMEYRRSFGRRSVAAGAIWSVCPSGWGW
jgi:hypothetical protein